MTAQPSPGQVEKVLEDLIQRLMRSQSTLEVRAALIEAKRLRTVTTRWAAIPPPPDARREMLTRVMDLIAQVGVSLSKPPPPPSSPPPAPKPAVSARPDEASRRPNGERGRNPPAGKTRPSVSDLADDLPRDSAPETLSPRERAQPHSSPGMVARGLTPTPLRSARAPERSGSQPDRADPSEEPVHTPRSRSGISVPPPASPRAAPPPLRGRRPSDELKRPGSPVPRQATVAFGSPTRGRTKTGLSESTDSARVARAAAPTQPPPPRSASPAAMWGRRETKMMGSQGVSDVLKGVGASLEDDSFESPVPSSGRESLPSDTAETSPPPSPPPNPDKQTTARSVPLSRGRVASVEPRLEGLSSAPSSPSIRAVPSAHPYQKKPSNPTLTLPTPVPAALRSAPPPSSSARTLRTVVSPGVTIVHPDAAEWQPHPVVAGVTLKVLFRDPRAGIFTALVRLAPGAVFPRRRHAASEEILLVSGLASVGGHAFRAGEYCRAESDSVHDPISTATGCTLFVCGSENDDFLDDA